MTLRLAVLTALLLLAACADRAGDPVQGSVHMRGSYIGGVTWGSNVR